MSDVIVGSETLTEIANAIREQTGRDDTFYPSEMPELIRSIEGRGIPGMNVEIIYDKSDWPDTMGLNGSTYTIPAGLKLAQYDMLFLQYMDGNNLLLLTSNPGLWCYHKCRSYLSSGSYKDLYFNVTLNKNDDTLTIRNSDTNTVKLNVTYSSRVRLAGIKFTEPQYNYSTEEQRIGTWIDGKPLYQRVVSFDDKPAVPNWAPLFDDTYYDQLVECKEIIKTGNNSYSYYSNSTSEPRYGILEHKLCYYRASALSGRKLIIQYTKTTD